MVYFLVDMAASLGFHVGIVFLLVEKLSHSGPTLLTVAGFSIHLVLFPVIIYSFVVIFRTFNCLKRNEVKKSIRNPNSKNRQVRSRIETSKVPKVKHTKDDIRSSQSSSLYESPNFYEAVQPVPRNIIPNKNKSLANGIPGGYSTLQPNSEIYNQIAERKGEFYDQLSHL